LFKRKGQIFMSKFSQYYSEIRAKTQELAEQFADDHCLVTAGKTTCEVPVPLAARLLVEGTHRLASKEEQDAFHEAQRLNRPPINGLDAARAAFAKLILKEGGPK
jgi:hypothetical protein